MREGIGAAERTREVREAARAWRRAGFIPEEALARIVAAYPDDRQRFGLGFRALAFIFTLIAAGALIGLWLVATHSDPDTGVPFLIWAAVMAALTEGQRGPWRRADAGAESATALVAAVLAVIAGTIGFGGTSYSQLLLRFMTSVFVVCALSAWHWGDKLFFLGGGLAGFCLLAQTDQGRLLWILTVILLIPACLRAERDIRLTPSHRWGALIVGAVAILALYGAVHIWSLDERLIEGMSVLHSATGERASPSLRTLSILATALLPPSLLLVGWRRREPMLLYGGLLLIGASIATIRLYREVMPLSFALILIGAACLALSLAARRWLRGGDQGERDGFTADPLFDNTNRTEAIRSVVAMASFTPTVQAGNSHHAFEGGGGSFGGGGATGSF